MKVPNEKLKLVVVLLILAISGCVQTRGVGLVPRETDNKVIQDLDSGGDMTNLTVNIVGEGMLYGLVGIFCLAVLGWIYANWMRRKDRRAMEAMVIGVETTGSHSPVKRDIQWRAEKLKIEKHLKKFVYSHFHPKRKAK